MYSYTSRNRQGERYRKGMPRSGKYRCNYYRMSSVVVVSFLLVFCYWTMFSSPSSANAEPLGTKRINERKSMGDLQMKQHNHRGVDNPRNGEGGMVGFGKEDFKIDDLAAEHDRKNDGGPNKITDFSTENERNKDVKLGEGQNGDDPHPIIAAEEIRDQNIQNMGRELGGQRKDKGTFNSQEANDHQEIQTKNQDQNLPQQPSMNQAVFHPSKNDNNNNAGVANANNDRWIVLTTIQLPTEDVKFLAQLEGWHVVVAGDTKTPAEWSFPNCVYLSVEKQKTLGFETVEHLPTKSYGRKNAAYLYAISHGAKIIYETDDDNRPTDMLKHFLYEPKSNGLRFVGGKVFNPYRHFGQPTLWPRGYPLGFIADNVTEDKYQLGELKTPLIQQGVVNGDPDMDAIFRLTRKRTAEMLNVSFDQNAPPAILPPGVLVPFNSQNTLFLYDALWALVLPTSVTFRVTDIWRGYWAQRLLWEIDGSLGFFAPNAFQKRNSHSYVGDALQEEDLYFKTHNLFEFLLTWRCDSGIGFFDCGRKLTADMHEKEFWGKQDVDLINAWFKDLKKIGYQEPTRKPFEMLNPQQVNAQPNGNTAVTNLFFTAAEMFPPMYYNSKFIMSSYWNRVQEVATLCKDSSFKVSTTSQTQVTNPGIVLVVVFKQTNYDSIPYLNILYGSKFPHIVYCGQDYSFYERTSKSFTEPFTFVEASVQNGYFSYRCLAKVMTMGYRVNGYLMISSDTLINPWTIEKQDPGKIWLDHSKYMTAISESANSLPNWPAWSSQFGRDAYNKAIRSIQEQSITQPLLATHYLKLFKSNLMKNTKSDDGLFVGPSDVVYIPSKLSDMFARYAFIFSQFNVFHEVVVPSVIFGLELRDHTVPLEGKYMWYDEEKQNYEQFYNRQITFLSPVKIMEKLSTMRGRQFFCKTYLPNIIGDRQSRGQYQSRLN